MTPLATTVQLAPGQGFWAGEGSLWRVQLQRCAEKLGHAWQPTSSCTIWTLMFRTPMTTEDWRSWPTVSHSSAACSCSGHPLCVCCARRWPTTAKASNRDGVVLTRARGRRRPPTPNLCDRAGRAKLVVLALEVGGTWSKEPGPSCICWPRHGRGRSHF